MSIIPAIALNTAKQGERVTVRLPDGKTVTKIAQTDIITRNVLVIGDRVLSQDGSTSELTRTQRLFKSSTNSLDERNYNLVSLWQEFYTSNNSIPLVAPKWSRGDGTGGGSGDNSSRFTRAPTGYDTLREAIRNRGVFTLNDTYVTTMRSLRRNFQLSKQHNAIEEIDRINIEEDRKAIEEASQQYATSVFEATTNIPQGRLLTVDGVISVNYIYDALDEDAEPRSQTVSYTTEDLLQVTGGTQQRQIFPAGGVTPAVTATLSAIPQPESIPGYGLRKIDIYFNLEIYLFQGYELWETGGKGVRWWLKFHDSSAPPVRLFECNLVEYVRVYLTATRNKAIFVIKIGIVDEEFSYKVNLLNFTAEYIFAKVIVIEVDRNGKKEEKTYSYPEPIEVNEDNWQKEWAYSYYSIYHPDNPIYSEDYTRPDCSRISRSDRRFLAAESEYIGSSFDLKRNKDYDFRGEYKYYTPGLLDGINPRFARGRRSNYKVTARPFPESIDALISYAEDPGTSD